MKFKKLVFVWLFGVIAPVAFSQQVQDPSKLEGRWDINVSYSGKQRPAWLEVWRSGNKTLVGRVMLMVGSARPISEVNFDNGKFNFTIPPQWDNGDGDIRFEGTLYPDSVSGTLNYVDKKDYTWSGTRAPSLVRDNQPQWDTPIILFNGKNLDGWHARGENNQWVVEGGELKSPTSGSDILTDRKFTDFKLHIEFRYAKNGNSGVYLRGRYEVQIADSKGLEPSDVQFSGIYGLLPPNEMVAKGPGEWQIFDIVLIGRRVTVVANGVPVITDQVIPGVTGGALDCKEGEPGPLLLQGDHNPIEFRNIILTPAKE